MNVSEAIRLKRAAKTFQDKPLPDEAAYAILDAGQAAGFGR